jgi:hypothetical protein
MPAIVDARDCGNHAGEVRKHAAGRAENAQGSGARAVSRGGLLKRSLRVAQAFAAAPVIV